MHGRRSLMVSLAIGAALAVVACAPKTTLLSSWLEPSFQPGHVSKVLVLGVAANNSMRRQYEDLFCAELVKEKIACISGNQWVPDPAKLDKDAIAQRARTEGVTYVIVTRVVDRQQVETYHPPTTASVGVYGGYGPAWYGSYGSFYSTGYSYVTSPGYVTTNDVVSLETNVYGTAKEDLVWSGMSETWVEGTGQKNLAPVIHSFVWELRGKKVL